LLILQSCNLLKMTDIMHEICDPIHDFIKLDSNERRVLDSPPVQRLRHISQLALTNLIYPGATHKRFEHSLGVMELAGRVFDVITDKANLTRRIMPMIPKRSELIRWRKILRIAALCHDIGHLPFSHSAESDLLKGKDHEDMTINIIKSDCMKEYWDKFDFDGNEIAKIAVGPKKFTDKFSDWEAILSEVITDNVFGVDRMV
jgi:HD superfamily phosphohydrolase